MKAMVNAGVMLGCRVLADSLNVLLFVVISRTYGAHGVGVYSYGFAVAGFIWAVTVLGIEDYGVREYQRAAPERRVALVADLLGLQLAVGAVAAAVLAIYLSLTATDSTGAFAVCALALFQFCNALAATLFVPAMAEQRMMRPAVTALVTRSIAFGLASILLLSGSASLGAALAMFPLAAVIYLASAARSARSMLGALRIEFSVPAIRQAIAAMWSFAAVEILGQVLARVGIIVLTLQLGERAAGIYATGFKLIEVAFLPLYFLTIATYPVLCRYFNGDRPAFDRLGSQLIWGTVGLSCAVALGMYFVVPLLLVDVFGPDYAGTEAQIAMMALLALVFGLEMMLGRRMFASHLHRRRAAIVAFGAALCAAANAALIPHWGVLGAVYATTLSYFVVISAYAIGSRKPAPAGLQQSVISP
jgi:O-antigen/teichoic acid export membrane protein